MLVTHPSLFFIRTKRHKCDTQKCKSAFAGSRTRIPCLEGADADRYTTNASNGGHEVRMYIIHRL